MTDTKTEVAPRPALADHPDARPIFAVAGATAVAGVFWFPAWFFSAQLLRLWAPRGGVAWFRRRGVPEYTDETYATVLAWAPLIPIVARIVVAFNWLQPFEVIANQRKDPVPAGEWTVLLDVVLGIAIGAALTGVMFTRGWHRLLALAGFCVVAAAALVTAFAPPFPINGFMAIPLVLLASLTSSLAVFFHNAPKRRARRAARESARIEDERIAEAARKERGY